MTKPFETSGWHVSYYPIKKDLSVDIKGKNEKIAQLEQQATAQDFWDDMENSQKVLQKTKQLKDKVERYEKIAQRSLELLSKQLEEFENE